MSGSIAPMQAQRQVKVMRTGSEGTSALQSIVVQKYCKCDMVPGDHEVIFLKIFQGMWSGSPFIHRLFVVCMCPQYVQVDNEHVGFL